MKGCFRAPAGWSANRKLGIPDVECCSVSEDWRLVPTVRKVE